MLTIFEEELKKIDAIMKNVHSSDMHQLFKNIPLETFGKLLLDIPSQYPNIKAFFPSMASEQTQNHWTGSNGDVLLNQSVVFVKTIIAGFASLSGKKISNASILDFGCGWGRLIRLLYKFTSIENIYGVDPFEDSIKECVKHNVKANLALSDYVPKSLPFEKKFDLIFAFSVFTHLSEKTAAIVLQTLRNYIDEDGLLVITTRPKEYWNIHDNGSLVSIMNKTHMEKGFAFVPHNRPPVDGDITFGDTSISLEYIDEHYSKEWKTVLVECNSMDPYQIIIFLKPV